MESRLAALSLHLPRHRVPRVIWSYVGNFANNKSAAWRHRLLIADARNDWQAASQSWKLSLVTVYSSDCSSPLAATHDALSSLLTYFLLNQEHWRAQNSAKVNPDFGWLPELNGDFLVHGSSSSSSSSLLLLLSSSTNFTVTQVSKTKLQGSKQNNADNVQVNFGFKPKFGLKL